MIVPLMGCTITPLSFVMALLVPSGKGCMNCWTEDSKYFDFVAQSLLNYNIPSKNTTNIVQQIHEAFFDKTIVDKNSNIKHIAHGQMLNEFGKLIFELSIIVNKNHEDIDAILNSVQDVKSNYIEWLTEASRSLQEKVCGKCEDAPYEVADCKNCLKFDAECKDVRICVQAKGDRLLFVLSFMTLLLVLIIIIILIIWCVCHLIVYKKKKAKEGTKVSEPLSKPQVEPKEKPQEKPASTPEGINDRDVFHFPDEDKPAIQQNPDPATQKIPDPTIQQNSDRAIQQNPDPAIQQNPDTISQQNVDPVLQKNPGQIQVYLVENAVQTQN